MKRRSLAFALFTLALAPAAGHAAGREIRGAAILEHPCGKVSVKHMGLVHAGKMAEALGLASKAMRDQWQALPAEDRKMMEGMMKEMSVPESDYMAQIRAGGVLEVEGAEATLTVTREASDADGSMKSVQTQRFRIDGKNCEIDD